MPLFEVVILEIPTKEQAEKGESERLVLGPKAIVARTADAAAFGVAREAGSDIDLNRIEVLVRPFAQAG